MYCVRKIDNLTKLSVVAIIALSSANAQNVTYTSLHDFGILQSEETNFANLIQASDGEFYGFTNDSGVFFKITSSGSFAKLLSEPAGIYEVSSLIEGPDGNFYGTDGGLFRITPSGDLSYVLSLPDGNSSPALADDGYLYVTSGEGGGSGCDDSLGCGEVVRLNLDGSSSVVYTFTGGSDGGHPAGLMQASDGNFYGFTDVGGNLDCQTDYYSSPGCGTLFKLTPSGKLTTLQNGTSGFDYLTPVEAGDGNLYVTSIPTGPDGTVLKIDLRSGGVSNFYTVPASGGYIQGLTPGNGNLLYGLTLYGAFVLTTSGQVQSENFLSTANEQGFDGVLTPGSDGNFYGTTDLDNGGTIFRLNISPPLPPPVQVSLSPAVAVLGSPVTASLAVNNAFSMTMQQCYAFVTNSGAVTALGKVPGSYNSATQLYTDSVTFTPTEAGTYRYAVTCGGVESGSATLTVDGHPTRTTLTASPATVDPPGNVSLAATVTRTDGSTVPTGTVTFYYQTVLLGSARLNGSGVATLAASSQGVAPGTYAVTATYAGDTADAGSSSSAVSVAVE